MRAVPEDGAPAVATPGRGSVANVGANPNVTLLFPPLGRPRHVAAGRRDRRRRRRGRPRHADRRRPAQAGPMTTSAPTGSARSSTFGSGDFDRGRRVLADVTGYAALRAARRDRRVRDPGAARRRRLPAASSASTTAPGRIHLDLHVDEPTIAAEAAVELGGHVLVRHEAGLRRAPLARRPRLLLRQPPGVASGRGRATWPDGHRSQVDQVCLDVPPAAYDVEVAFWQGLTGWDLTRGRRARVRAAAAARRPAAALAGAAARRRRGPGPRPPRPGRRRPRRRGRPARRARRDRGRPARVVDRADRPGRHDVLRHQADAAMTLAAGKRPARAVGGRQRTLPSGSRNHAAFIAVVVDDVADGREARAVS